MRRSSTVRHALVSLALAASGLVALSSPAAAADVPGQVLDLTNWKLTIPLDGPDPDPYADEIKQPELATYENHPYFRDVATGPGVLLRAPTDGATTNGSHYPRSELREMTNGGADEASWRNDDGKSHVMTWELAVMQVPDVKPHLVVGQIHSDSRDILALRAERKSDGTYRIFAKANDKTLVPDLDSDYQLGTRFKAQFKADGHGVVIAKYWKTPTSTTFTRVTSNKRTTTADVGWYFKAGCYPQASSRVPPTDSHYGTGYGKVVIYKLAVSHS